MEINGFTLRLLIPSLIASAAACHPTNAAQVPIAPSPSLDDLVDDPLDPSDDPDAFLLSPSGRFRFDNFMFSAVPSGEFTPTMEHVFVTLTEMDDSVMLLFQIVGRNLAVAPESFDVQIGYEAHALDPLDAFTGQALFMNGVGLGDAEVVLNELVLNDDDELVGQLTTYSNLPGQGTEVIDTSTFSSRQRSIQVDKDVALTGGTQEKNGVAFLSHFKQTYHVERIPEPGTVLLLALGGIGLVAVGALRRNRGRGR